MIYYDPNTRKRPEFERVWMKVVGDGVVSTGVAYIMCPCGEAIIRKDVAFNHWQYGHFDEYDEYKEKREKI
jgi:hypothetical protein